MNNKTATECWKILHTVFDLISEHALISGHPPFFEIKKLKILIYFFSNFFFF